MPDVIADQNLWVLGAAMILSALGVAQGSGLWKLVMAVVPKAKSTEDRELCDLVSAYGAMAAKADKQGQSDVRASLDKALADLITGRKAANDEG